MDESGVGIEDSYSPSELSALLGKTTSTVYRWLREGKISGQHQNGGVRIPRAANAAFIRSAIVDPARYAPTAYVPPELDRYHRWHELLDEFTWLLKVTYSERDVIKRKTFRLDELYVHYIRYHRVDLRRLQNAIKGPPSVNPRIVADDLKRGWYNELAFALPTRPSTLGLSFNDITINKTVSDQRFRFPSWRVIIVYYAIYFYLRGVASQKAPGFRFQEHAAAIAVFKHNVAPALRGIVWCFPFDIAYNPDSGKRGRAKSPLSLPQLHCAYTNHPRPPHRSPQRIYARLLATYRRRGSARKRPAPYGLFDLMHDLRIWANYLEIDNLLSLWGPGYRAFLDQNLATMLYFLGGMAELCFIASFGSREYERLLQEFYDAIATNDVQIQEDFLRSPMFQRQQLHIALGFSTSPLTLLKKSDPNEIQLPNQSSSMPLASGSTSFFGSEEGSE